MSIPIQIGAGDLITQGPTAQLVYQFDWTTELAAGVLITASAFTYEVLRPTWDAATALAALTHDNELIDPSTSRKTQIRLASTLRGATYRVTNTVTTNESPSEVEPKGFDLLIE